MDTTICMDGKCSAVSDEAASDSQQARSQDSSALKSASKENFIGDGHRESSPLTRCGFVALHTTSQLIGYNQNAGLRRDESLVVKWPRAEARAARRNPCCGCRRPLLGHCVLPAGSTVPSRRRS